VKVIEVPVRGEQHPPDNPGRRGDPQIVLAHVASAARVALRGQVQGSIVVQDLRRADVDGDEVSSSRLSACLFFSPQPHW